MDGSSLLAPARGRYDRRKTPEERLRAQRWRLMQAVARAFVEREPSVSHVAALSRVGRASFYEFFDDFEHALGIVRALSIESLDRALDAALTRERAPVAALRSLTQELLESLQRWPEASLVALASDGEEISPLGRSIERALRRWFVASQSAGLITLRSDSERLLLATGAAEAFARRVAIRAAARAPAVLDAVTQLSDALLRLLR
jgi:AcrR family transcriptional regulator